MLQHYKPGLIQRKALPNHVDLCGASEPNDWVRDSVTAHVLGIPGCCASLRSLSLPTLRNSTSAPPSIHMMCQGPEGRQDRKRGGVGYRGLTPRAMWDWGVAIMTGKGPSVEIQIVVSLTLHSKWLSVDGLRHEATENMPSVEIPSYRGKWPRLIDQVTGVHEPSFVQNESCLSDLTKLSCPNTDESPDSGHAGNGRRRKAHRMSWYPTGLWHLVTIGPWPTLVHVQGGGGEEPHKALSSEWA